MSVSNNYYFIHAVFKMNNLEVDNLLYYRSWVAFLSSLNTKMQEINDSLYRNYPNAYINTNHHVLRDNEREIILDRYETTSGKSQLSSEEFWQIIQSQMKELKENSTGGKSEMGELQRLLRLFNDFLRAITTNGGDQDVGSLKVVIQASALDQFASYFIDFLLSKANSEDDFLSEKIQPHIDSLLSLRNNVDLELVSKNTLQLEQFWEWIKFYQGLQDLTDQWVDYQVN